jgi:peptidoglycan/LPS O-acetylase OafA/YrhL
VDLPAELAATAPEPPASPTSPWEANRHGANNLDFLRLALAVLVIFSHAYPIALGGDAGRAAEPFMVATRGQISGGELAVDGFFILSGFLITQSALNASGLADFARKRLRRIYPGFLVAWAFCVLVVGPLAVGGFAVPPLAESARNVVRAALLWEPAYPGAFASNPFPLALNGSLWTIKYEIACYGLTALLWATGLLRRRAAVLVLLLAFLSLTAGRAFGVLPLPEREFSVSYLLLGKPTEWVRLVACYLAGAAFFLWRERIPRSPLWAVASAVTLLAGCFAPPLLPVLLPVFGAYLLLYAGFSPVKPLTGAAKRGDLSYGVYLYAFPVQQLLQHYFPTLPPLAQFALALPPTFLLAALSWHLIEKRFLIRSRREGRAVVARESAKELPAGPR